MVWHTLKYTNLPIPANTDGKTLVADAWVTSTAAWKTKEEGHVSLIPDTDKKCLPTCWEHCKAK